MLAVCLFLFEFVWNKFELSFSSEFTEKVSICGNATLSRKETEPSHSRPFPRYPCLHVQLYDPLVLLQKASRLQLCDPSAHSSMSERIKHWKDLKKSNCESACNLHACYYLFQFEELIFWLGSRILLTTKWHPFVQELVCLTTDNVQLINSKFYTLNCFSHP